MTQQKDWALYRQPTEGGWLRYEIVGETPAGREAGLQWFLREYKYHEARIERGTETSLTVKVCRRESC